MSRSGLLPPALIILAASVSAQSAASIANHVDWERDYPTPAPSVLGAAVADRAGNLWAVGPSSDRLMCIRADGEMVVNTELPKEIRPADPPGGPIFSLAVSPLGTVVLIARYSHAVGRAIYSDGAAFAIVNPDGKLGPVKKVAAPGPEYKELVALSDEHFLLIGDQSPMIVGRLSSDGDATWRRTFPANWVLPSGAALPDGSSCIVSPDYGRALLHLVWIDKNGTVSHREQLTARRSRAVSSGGSCTILYDSEPGLRRSEFHLTSFDRNFHRAWTTDVLDSAPQGGVYGVAAVSDGYVVTIGLGEGLYLAKFGLTGQMLWVTTDTSREHADLLIPAGASLYLIGGGPRSRRSLHVIRAH